MRKKKPDPELIDEDNPEWTPEDFRLAEPGHVALPRIFGAEAAAKLLSGRGRPRKERPKIAMTIRFDSEIVEAFKTTGRGWQSRMNAALKDWLTSHPIL